MHIYLIHGPDAVEVQNERIRIVDQLLPVDQRDENLTEYNPSGSRPLTLRSILPDLLAELGTASFFPGVLRVAVVNELSDFWESEEKKAKTSAKKTTKKGAKTGNMDLSAVDRLIRYLETDYDPESSAVVFTVHEDEEKWRTVNLRGRLSQFIEMNGSRKAFKRTPVVFQLGDAILDRNLPKALALFRLTCGRGKSDQEMAVFNAILRDVRFLLQAKIVAGATRTGEGISQAAISAEFLPGDKRNNLLEIHDFRRRKYMEGARRFSVLGLTSVLTELYNVGKHLIPGPGDLHVADTGFLLERILIQLCSDST